MRIERTRALGELGRTGRPPGPQPVREVRNLRLASAPPRKTPTLRWRFFRPHSNHFTLDHSHFSSLRILAPHKVLQSSLILLQLLAQPVPSVHPQTAPPFLAARVPLFAPLQVVSASPPSTCPCNSSPSLLILLSRCSSSSSPCSRRNAFIVFVYPQDSGP